jgi:hypothetical protein
MAGNLQGLVIKSQYYFHGHEKWALNWSGERGVGMWDVSE